MKKLVFAILLIPALSFAQIEELPTSKVERGANSKSFFIKDAQEFRFKEYENVFSNEQAIGYMRKAKTNKSNASILTYSGGAILGLGVGVYVITKSTEGNFLGYILSGSTIALGAGIMLSSIPLWMGYSKNIKKAIDVENGDVQESNAQLNLNINGNGFGLAYQF
ncbi:hypothetical protein [Moheibacter lacus]|uniref:Uncharacterized protein n=1 Tax=Moheibacter lacus TaxID=2745851 RepID=A0A838ZI93_9FLAO|nr:hypothetical protein [Moheibacter lacus]MBA5628958.1 hypothetical protein [Moheibacter lacus]